MKPKTGILLLFALMTILYTGLNSGQAVAEIWECRADGKQTPTLTDAPAPAANNRCKVFDLSRSAYIRLPADQFQRLGPAAGPLQTPVEKSSEADTRAQLRLDRTFGMKPTTSFNAKEVAGKKRGNFDRKCEVSGTARSEEAGEGVVRIRRGALTVDDVPVRLGGKGKPVKWRTSLAGDCRNPEVTVVVE